MNFLKCKKYEWVINKKFTSQGSERVKEAIIETFIRTRLKEGFKCIFQSTKFVVLNLQMFLFEKNRPKGKSNASPQTCTFFYVVYFQNESSNSQFQTNEKNSAKSLFNSKNKLTNRLNSDSLLKKTTSLSKEDDYANNPNGEKKSEKVFFRTELYFEDIQGVSKQYSVFRSKEMNKIGDYFKNLTNNEIVNLIHLIDLKAFLSLQSIYSLFLNKSDFIENVSAFRHYSKVDLENLCSSSTLTKIQNFEPEFFDLIRILPDLNILFRRNSFKLSKLDFSKSTNSANLHNRIDFKTKKSVSWFILSFDNN